MPVGKRGPEPGSEKAKRGGQAVREKYGADFYRQIGQKGGQSVKAQRGSTFYAEIGRKGGRRVRELIEQGKRAAQQQKETPEPSTEDVEPKSE